MRFGLGVTGKLVAIDNGQNEHRASLAYKWIFGINWVDSVYPRYVSWNIAVECMTFKKVCLKRESFS